MDTYPNKERKSRRRIDIHEVGLAVMGSDIVQNVETKGLVPTSSCLSAKVPDSCVELKVFELLPGDRGCDGIHKSNTRRTGVVSREIQIKTTRSRIGGRVAEESIEL